MNLTTTVIFGAGALLLYAAIKNQSPITVVKNTLSGQVLAPSKAPAGTTVTPPPNNITPGTGYIVASV